MKLTNAQSQLVLTAAHQLRNPSKLGPLQNNLQVPMALCGASSGPQSESPSEPTWEEKNCVHMMLYLSLNVAKPLLPCPGSSCGVSAARAQLIWNPEASLTGNSVVCVWSTRMQNFSLPSSFLKHILLLPTVGNPHFQFFDDKAQNFQGLTKCCGTHLLFNYPHSIISLSFVDCFMLPICCSSSASHYRGNYYTKRKVFVWIQIITLPTGIC